VSDDGPLSQEDIDALFGAGAASSEPPAASEPTAIDEVGQGFWRQLLGWWSRGR
jgi:hypothetical protein